MRFTTVLAVLAAPLVAFAQSTTTATASTTVAAGQATSTANPFKIPTAGLSGTAGETLTLSWTPTTSGTVSLLLRSGSSNDLDAGTTIASKIDNSGSYAWAIPADTVRNSDYAIEIVDDDDTSETNFTPYFVIDSTVTVASSTSSSGTASTASATTLSTTLSTASATGSATSVTDSSSSTAAASGSSSSSSSGSSSSTSSGSSSSTTTSGSVASATSSAASAVAETGAAGARATAAAGLMGLVAIGAFAL